ncbi:hypothetical protein MJC1_03007 [Methylocystis sp. MJC1]|nr:hypothetical protein MJC1_03007 [Methylocystis sp. MJC1]
MKSAVICSLAAALALSGAAFAADETCSDKTLQGSYIFSASGTDKSPIAEAGMVGYDGAGNVVFKGKYSNNAEISLKGTYKISGNCRGEVRYEDGRTVTFFVTPSGDELTWVVTSGPILASNSWRVSKSDLIGMKP